MPEVIVCLTLIGSPILGKSNKIYQWDFKMRFFFKSNNAAWSVVNVSTNTQHRLYSIEYTIETHSLELSTYLRIEMEHFGSFEWHKMEPYL